MLDKLIEKLNENKSPIMGLEQMKKFAVIIPLIEQDNKYYVLFEKRAKSLRRQPGEISFPGGKVEANDYSPKEAALRETCEELGLPKKYIDIIGQLGAFVPFRKSVIFPYVANILSNRFKPNPDEVEEIFFVPLEFFLNYKPEVHKIKLKVEAEENFPFHLIPGGEKYPWRFNYIDELFYHYNGYVIWGMTATILNNFILTIK